MKKLMVGLFAVAAAMGVYGADQISWFTENATTVAAALEAQGKSTDGTWTSTDGLSVADARIEVDADEETPVAYAPDAELKGDTATLTFKDVSFGAAYTVDQLPVLDENAQVGVVLKATDGGAVFAVVENGVWKATEVAADPETSYTIVCEVSYADQTVTYSCGATKIATVGDTAAKRISTLKLGGSGSLASLGATRAELVPALATVTDTEPPTIEGDTYDVAKVFISGDPAEKAGAFEGWNADFVVTVDKDVEAGAIALAGNLGDWAGFPMGALKAGEPFMLLKSIVGEDVPYGMVVEMQTFPCALKNINVTNDTTITVTLVAMKGTETRELASFDYEIKAKEVGPKSDEGTIEPADPKTGIAEFKPTDDSVKEATIDLGDFTGKIAIPSTIETLKGVPAEKIYVRNANGNVIDAAAFIGGDENGYSTELTPAAQNPAFGATEDGETKESPFVITGGDVALGVKTLAGLTYQLKKATTLGASATWENVGAPVEGDGNAMALKAEKAAQDPAAFYKVEVTK